MKSFWNDEEACAFARAFSGSGDVEAERLALRVYSSRLLGRDPSLVLHGGGNTSLKSKVAGLFGDVDDVLFVKGSGWNLATIEAGGFSPVKMDVLLRMARLETLSDPDMVRAQRAAMTNPSAPVPSVEAILHAVIRWRFVDHTHADAVVAVSNTPGGEEKIRRIYGERVLVIPYVMPGFLLARKVFEHSRGVDWSRYDGMVLLNHGIFSFGDTARESYERMIQLVTLAEDYIRASGAMNVAMASESAPALKREDLLTLASGRAEVSRRFGRPVVALLDRSQAARGFAEMPGASPLATRGPLTPDHVIHTKRVPVIVEGDFTTALDAFEREYDDYFKRNTNSKLTRLDAAPRWAVWPGRGTIAFGGTVKRASVVADIVRHTVRAIQWAEGMGGWCSLNEDDIFDVEYWDLEQAKLAKNATTPSPLEGKVALVTGAASGIGKACVEAFRAQGVAVAAIDKDPAIATLFAGSDVLGIVCDVTDPVAIGAAIVTVVERYGGLDILFSNAGSFPSSAPLTEIGAEDWRRGIELNLSSHHYVMRACIPFLEKGVEPAIVIMGSKNVPAPGPGAAVYSSAKAALTQLARVAALELAPHGIRVNIVHPHGVFDTGIWTPETLSGRARHYGMTVEQYKSNNLLHVEIASRDVAAMVCALAGPLFSKTTGAQIPIDGGSDRVI